MFSEVLTSVLSNVSRMALPRGSFAACMLTGTMQSASAGRLPQLPIFLIAPSSVCNVPSLLISIGSLNGVNEPGL